jgi:hypothetical protein
MIKLRDILNESRGYPDPMDIIGIIRRNYPKYKNFGLRSLSKDVPVQPGDTLRNSNQWTWSGEDSGVSLGGVSTIGIFSAKEADIRKYLEFVAEYGGEDSALVLVGGPKAKRGQDKGELVIKDAIALEVWE